MVLLTGCACLQANRPPTVTERLANQPAIRILWAHTDVPLEVQGSEITVLVPPLTPSPYWTCLLRPEHQKIKAMEMERWVLKVRWRPVMQAGALHVRTTAGKWLLLTSEGADRGHVEGVPVAAPIEHLANGNLVHLSWPLPPLPANPCRDAWSASYPTSS